MITKQDYIERVLAKMKPRPDDPTCVERHLDICLPSDERMSSLTETMELFGLEPKDGRDGLLLCADISEAKSVLTGVKYLHNWQYDRTTECLLINLNMGRHEHLSALLYKAYTGEWGVSTYDAAELFITQGLGWFRSTTSHGRALKGRHVTINAQERAVFGDTWMHIED